MLKYESKALPSIYAYTIENTQKNSILQQVIKHILPQKQILCKIEYGSLNIKRALLPLTQEKYKKYHLTLKDKFKLYLSPLGMHFYLYHVHWTSILSSSTWLHTYTETYEMDPNLLGSLFIRILFIESIFYQAIVSY